MLRRVTAVVRTPALVRNTPLAMGSLRTLATVSGPGQPAAAGRPRRDEHSPRSAAFSPLAAPSARRGNTGSGYTRLPRSSTDGSSDGDGAMLRSKRGGAANVSPSPTTTTHASAYRTHFPAARAIYDTPPTRRPYETILTIRKKVRVSATGKHMKFDAYCLAGDRCGSVGYAHATSTQANKAVQTALRLARGRMRHYPLFEGRTLFHDMEARHRKLRIGLWAKPAGMCAMRYALEVALEVY